MTTKDTLLLVVPTGQVVWQSQLTDYLTAIDVRVSIHRRMSPIFDPMSPIVQVKDEIDFGVITALTFDPREVEPAKSFAHREAAFFTTLKRSAEARAADQESEGGKRGRKAASEDPVVVGTTQDPESKIVMTAIGKTVTRHHEDLRKIDFASLVKVNDPLNMTADLSFVYGATAVADMIDRVTKSSINNYAKYTSAILQAGGDIPADNGVIDEPRSEAAAAGAALATGEVLVSGELLLKARKHLPQVTTNLDRRIRAVNYKFEVSLHDALTSPAILSAMSQALGCPQDVVITKLVEEVRKVRDNLIVVIG